jgi:hypothetical protein
MRRLITGAAAVVLPALLVSAFTIGCSGDNKTSTEPSKTESKKGAKAKLEPVASTGSGTLKGRVTLEGAPPDIANLNKNLNEQIDKNTDKKFCLEAPPEQTGQQVWRLGKDKGVADVFVWVAPPEGQYFKVDVDKKTWPAEVVIDQPHCAFVPHAAVAFPSAYDPDKPKDGKPTGQKFIVKNSASFNHNTNMKGGDKNLGFNEIIASKSQKEVDLVPSSEPVTLTCNIHTWMNGVVRVFDHPYATVTDKDGNFEIKNVPAGADVNIVVWHEKGLYGDKGPKGDKVKLEADKETKKDYTIQAQAQ